MPSSEPPSEPPRARARPTTLRTSSVLLAAFGAVNVLYLSLLFFSQLSARAIESAASRIANDAALKIRALSAARGEIRRVESIITRDVDLASVHREIPWGGIDESMLRLGTEIDEYELLAGFDDESAVRARIGTGLAELEQEVRQISEVLARGDVVQAQALANGNLAPTVTQLGTLLMSGVEINTTHARRLALQIRTERERALRVSLWFGSLTLLLSLAIAASAMRMVRRYETALDCMREKAEGRADELEQFAGRVAHDIASPLTSAALALQLVDRDVDDARLQNVVTRGRSALARVQRLVAGLLEFARAGAAPAEGARAELRAVVDDVVGGLEPVAQDAGVSLAIENVPSVDVRCSPGVLTSLVSNLVQNAIKYMGESSVRTVTVRAIERGKCVRVEVEDTGPGLPPGLEPTVFEPYVRGGRSSQPGLGLGLATVKRVACSHHGAVGVEPGPNGTGARFWFEIPRADEDSS